MLYRSRRRFCLAFAVVATWAGGPSEQSFHDPGTGKDGRYTLQFPDNRSGKPGLLIYFHGSGGAAAYAAGFSELYATAQKHGLAALALQAPNMGLTWADPDHGPSLRHYDYVKALLDKEIFPRHPEIDHGRIVFTGVSAGSTFISGDFLPRYGQDYAGGAVMLCGGGGPVGQVAAQRQELSLAFRRGFKLYYAIGKGDFLYGQTMAGTQYWQRRGLSVHLEVPPGTGHCGFPLNAKLDEGIKQVLGG